VCGPATVLHRPTGTIHDDATDQAIDCTQGGCNGADTGNNGYGDNLDCNKIIQAPANTLVSLDFSHMALEAGDACGAANNGVGCDIVTIYDGPNTQSPVLGTFSGNDVPERLISTGTALTVRFQTDTGNYGFSQAGVTDDPGFYADWHFVDVLPLNGDGICPAPAEYTVAHGTIRDDEHTGVNCAANAQQWGNSQQCGMGGNNAGYADNTACYTTIRAPEDEQVRLTFTQMNLELTGCSAGQPNGGCPDGGCDYVEVRDGLTPDSPVIGRYSGALSGAQLPSVVSSGNGLYILFRTDVGNCGVTGTEDPGFFADWDFVENGQNICEPDSGVLRDTHGVLRDDDTVQQGAYGNTPGSEGYLDNADCGVRIRGRAGTTINFHLVQMNLEGDGNGICDPNSQQYIGHSCDENGGDFLEIYDGRDANAPLLARVTGQPTDQVLTRDSFTSTGRDMYIHFTTDAGNYGLTGTTSTPGFYGEWQIIDDGAACDTGFTSQRGMALVGHNNEAISGTPDECIAACCARPWCQSFDYIQSTDTLDAGEYDGTCNLADVNAATQYGSTVANPYNTLYEKPADVTPGSAVGAAAGPIGAAGCSSMLGDITQRVNHVCCPAGGCDAGVPNTCSEDCSAVWMPFARQCSEWIKGASVGALTQITAKCEREEYGRYKPGRTHGRCSDADLTEYFSQFLPACCGPNAQYCPQADPANPSIVTPMSNGQPVCSPECAEFAEEFNSECHPRLEAGDGQDARDMSAFLAVCQGVPAAGGGHRRAEGDESEQIIV
jgi:hypothetical protein